MYSGNLHKFRITLLVILLSIICNTTYCAAKLSLFNVNREELGSFDTVNFMWIKNSFNDSFSTNGSLAIVEFSTTSSPCTLKLPSIRNITVLLISFDRDLRDYGCSSYADVIQRNKWLTMPEIAPIFSPSMIILFSSTNGGDPGIREQYYGDLDTLSNYELKLALIRKSDTVQVSYLKPEVSFVEFTSDLGPWINLLDSRAWRIWTILFGILYSSIITLAFASFVFAIKRYKFKFKNPRLWLFIAIMIYTFISLVIMEYDPWSIHDNFLSELKNEIIFMTGYYILCICYAIYLFSWIKATGNLTDAVTYKIALVRKLSRITKSVAIIVILIKTASIIFYLLLFSPKKIEITLPVLRVIFTVLESLFCLILILSFGTFGVIIFLARIHEQKQKTRRNREHRPPGSRNSHFRREILLSGILTISITMSLVFITVQKITMIYLPITIQSFWIIRITNDVTNIFCSLVLMSGLYSNTIGKYSHTMHNGSSDENITTSTTSRDSSLHNVDAIDSVTTAAEDNNSRHRRSTMEVLFGRNSLGL